MIATAGYYRYKPEENLFPAKCESRQHALMIRRPDAERFDERIFARLADPPAPHD